MADDVLENARGLNGDTLDLDPADPQLVASMAINDVIELARAMSPASDFGRGAIEMRRRLAIMDAALVAAEKAGVVRVASTETVQ